jgi:polysaccharide export outer membrane protein
MEKFITKISGVRRHFRRILLMVDKNAIWNSCSALTTAAFTVFVVANLWGQASQTVSKQPSEAFPQSIDLPVEAGEYIIGPDDVLNISILDVPELSGEFRVSNTGKVTLPVLSHSLNAAGLTLTQFSQLLAKDVKTAGLISDPHVNTSVSQSRVHSVAVTGAVRHPQVYTLFSRTTLHDVLSQAEGLSEDAGGVAIVQRGEIAMRALAASDEKPPTGEQVEAGQTVTIDLTKLLEMGDSKLNIPVFPGDRVTIPHAGIVYVVGSVIKPGGFTMRSNGEGMTVLQALALAGDTKTTAIRNQTVIIRKDPQSPDGRKQIPVELKKVLSGKVSDPVLQADDILFIPDSTGQRILRRSLEAVLQTTTGIAVYRGR